MVLRKNTFVDLYSTTSLLIRFLKNLLTAIFFSLPIVVFSQATIVTGKVTEASNGTPIPFANVIFSGTQDGAITDFEGNFTAKTNQRVDSVEVHYIGFIKRVKALDPGKTQVINFQLDEDVQTLGEVVVFAGENPAWPIMRNVIEHKKQNDKRSLDAFEYESYTKVEFDVDNISDWIKQRKIMRKITNVLDSIEQIAGDDGKPILPIFISEAISKYYYKNDPVYRKEHILKTKVSGVGITDGTTTSQIIGSTFQEYNFYQNWLNIVTKEFVSPLTEGWKLYYDVYLEDSLYIGDDYCYRIDFQPKREQDLAFTGSMWITKEDYALRRIDATVPKAANLNYIEKIKIQQDLIKTSAGPWLPLKTRVIVDISQVTKQTAGLLAKFYVSTKDHLVNEPKQNEFYQNRVTMEEEVTQFDDNYWNDNRHDPLTETEQNVFHMIDTLKKIPVVKTYIDLAKFVVNGYYRIGPLDIGPYSTFLGKNNIEGWRVGFGARTTMAVSNKYTFGGYIGYGFDDDRFKYKFYVDRILDRQPWTTIRYEQQKEVEQVWLLNENIEPTSLFYSLSRFGTLTQPFVIQKYRLSFFRQLRAGLGTTVSLKNEKFNPLFNFNYYKTFDEPETASEFSASEVSVAVRYARDEVFVVDDNRRVSLGPSRWPAFDLDYTYGLKGVIGSDFSYHRFKLSVEKKQKMGILGVSDIKLSGGYVLGDLPYPMLYNTIGNETNFYVNFAYNLMNYFEFSTDKYVELKYRHSFEGFILNAIPLVKKLKLRLIGSANILYGAISDRNVNMAQYETDENENTVLPFRKLDHRPYVELGYGVENIFKIFSVEAFHRLTYLENDDVSRFGLKFSVQIIL